MLDLLLPFCIRQFQAWPPPPPWATPRASHILVAPGVSFHSSVLPGGVLNQSKISIILKKVRFLLCLLNNWVAALFICFFMLEVSSVTWSPFTLQQIHSISEFIQVNWNSSGQNFIGSRTKTTKLYSRFLLLTINLDSRVQTSANTDSIQICSVMAKFFYTVI